MQHDDTVGVAILGATGYSGMEAMRLLLGHPRVRLLAASSRQSAGMAVRVALPALDGCELTLDDDAAEDYPERLRDRGVNAVFACLPHGVFAARAERFLAAGLRVVDLSGDFRLATSAAFARHYHMAHPAPELLGEAVYALCDWLPQDLRAARLVSNPGCYATAMLLASLPAVRAGWLQAAAPVVVTAISGLSGAGRAAKVGGLLAEMHGGVLPYRVGDSHAHVGEVSEAWGRVGVAGPLVFSPHIAPMARGIAATVALPLAGPRSQAAARQLYCDAYAGRSQVRVLAADALPETRHVRGSNRCDLAVRGAAGGALLLVFCAIDNLLRGAAGQAVQNLNRMYGWDETIGLQGSGWACA